MEGAAALGNRRLIGLAASQRNETKRKMGIGLTALVNSALFTGLEMF